MRTPSLRLTFYALLIAFVSLSLIYSVTVPLFEGPDEIWHYAFANHLASGGGLPVFDVSQPDTFLRNGAHPPLYYALIAVLIAPIERGDFPADYRFNLASPKVTAGASGTSPNLLIHTAREDFPYRTTALAGHLARLVSIALGALTVVGIFAVARRVLHDDRLALIATALAAFIPQFVYGAALINNDALAAASAAWLLYALLRWMDGARWRWTVASGILLGIVLLSKIGMIAVLPIPALALLLHWRQARRAPHDSCFTFYTLHGLLMYALALLIAGWWYARNLVLYGDPLLWREWQALTGAGRVPPTPIDFLHDMIGLFGTFWADFSLRVDRTLWPLFGVIAIVAIIGLIRRTHRRAWPALDWPGLLVALVWLALLSATAVRYSFNIYDIHGRLLYPALAAIGVVLALGLSGWPKWIIGSVLTITIGLAVLAPFTIVQPAYARPIVRSLPDDALKTSTRFGDVELIGYRLKSDQVKTGDPVELDTYWRRTLPASASEQVALRAVVTLPLLQFGALLGRAEAILGTDAYPSWAWQPNEIIATHLNLTVDTAPSAVGLLQLGVRGNTEKLIVTDAGETVELGRVVVRAPEACNRPATADVSYGKVIKLVGYRIEQSTTVGEPSRVVLCWELLQPTNVDYTVFVHVIDAKGDQFSADAQPRGGTYPTSAWRQGEQIEDSHLLPAVIDLIIKQVGVGLYRLDTGERLPIDGADGTEFVITK